MRLPVFVFSKGMLQLGELLGEVKRGLSSSQIDRFPVRTVSSTTNVGGEEVTEPKGECPVCCSAYEADEKLRQLPCFHEFHVECIDRWIKVSQHSHVAAHTYFLLVLNVFTFFYSVLF